MAITYFGVKLSENWIERADGSLIFRNAVIARTGFQVYKGKELDANELAKAGIKVEPEQDVQLYRSPEEVFSPRTLGSFESVPVTDTHPDEMLSPENIQDHQCGHVQNVRKGAETLENGDWPLIADVIVTSLNLIEKIKAGLRQLSCGYNYHILKVNGVLNQVDMIGNHVAFVEVGRAGPEASIKDSASVVENNFDWRNFNMANTANKLKTLIATGLLHLAKTATPEEFAIALDAASEEKEPEKKEAKDAHPEDCKCPNCMGGKDAAADAKAKDRKRYHDALDKLMDGKEEEQNAADADMEELKSMFTSKGKDAAKGEDADEDEEDAEAGDESPLEMEKTAATDEGEALIVEPIDRPENPDPSAVDSAFADGRKQGAMAVLKSIRPLVAKSTDKKLRGAFDTALKLVTGASAPSKGSYSAVATASSNRSKAALDAAVNGEQKAIDDANKAYADMKKAQR